MTDHDAFTPDSDTSSPPLSPSSTQALVLDDDQKNGKPVISYGTNTEPKKSSTVVSVAPEVLSSEEYVVYTRRFFILFIFVALSMSNAFQWIQFAIITNIVTKYYGVDDHLVNWTSMLYMITYIPLIFPASWYLQKRGLRSAIILGSFGTMVGSCIKVGSVDPTRFNVTFVGQTIVAISQIFILGIPPRLAAVWFGSDQVSTACAVGVFGNQFGIALGFLIPPILVPDSDNPDDITRGLYIMFIMIAVITTLLFILIMFVFQEKPPSPPSAAAAAAEEDDSASYLNGIKRLAFNRGYVLLLLSYGINVGAFYAISTLLNQVVLSYFPGKGKEAGQIGLLIVVAGMCGSVACGYVLDKTAKFKLVTLVVYVMSLVTMLGYTFIFQANVLALVYVMAALLGFFMTGYLPVGFEFAAELTYPEPEGTSSGLLNASAQLFGILLTLADGVLLDSFGDKAANLLLVGTIVIGLGLTALIKEDLRRQNAKNKSELQHSMPIEEQETVVNETERI